MADDIQTIRLIAEMLDSLGVAVCLFDDTPATLLWNHSFLTLFPEHAGHVHAGEPYAENLRRFYRGRLSPSELPSLERHVADGVMRHTLQRLPYVFEHRGRWLRVASLPVPGIGRLRIWTAIASPTALDTMSDTLARVTQQADISRSIADVADGLMLRGRDGTILAVNHRFSLLYRLEGPEEVRGQSYEALLRRLWGDGSELESALLALADNQRFQGAPFEIPLPGQRWVRVSEQPTREGALVSIHADISELRRLRTQADEARQRAEAINQVLIGQIAERERAEAALRQVQRMEALGQITGGIAHDFGNLLSVVLGNLDMLSSRETDETKLRRLAVARSAADRGASLTNQLLAFARQQPLQPVPVNLNALVEAMAPLLRSALGARVELAFELPPRLRTVMVDPTQIELVVLNLAINARDAMPGGGRLTVGALDEDLLAPGGPDQPPPGRYVCLFVADTGAGMPPEVLARAFEPFFTTKQSGSGLGLSQTYGLARQSGGMARISSSVGQGTRVEVLLPAVSETAPDGPRPAEAPAPRTATILVVDDNIDVRDTTANVLQRLGYQTRVASNGTAALDMLRSDPGIDLLLTDVSMPVMTGPELARAARLLWPGLPIVMFSGFVDPDGLADAPADVPLLRKPIRSRDLGAAIAKALARGQD